MKAIWNNTILAESNETVIIEGNHYFPKKSVNIGYFKDSKTNTTCPWKGLAGYYDVVVNDEINKDAAWYYANPTATSKEIVKHDYSNYVAFWKGVEVVE